MYLESKLCLIMFVIILQLCHDDYDHHIDYDDCGYCSDVDALPLVLLCNNDADADDDDNDADADDYDDFKNRFHQRTTNNFLAILVGSWIVDGHDEKWIISLPHYH